MMFIIVIGKESNVTSTSSSSLSGKNKRNFNGRFATISTTNSGDIHLPQETTNMMVGDDKQEEETTAEETVNQIEKKVKLTHIHEETTPTIETSDAVTATITFSNLDLVKNHELYHDDDDDDDRSSLLSRSVQQQEAQEENSNADADFNYFPMMEEEVDVDNELMVIKTTTTSSSIETTKVMVTEKGIEEITGQEGVLVNAVSTRTRRGRPVSSSKPKATQQSTTRKPTNNTSKPVLTEEEKVLRAQQKREKEIEENAAPVPDLLRNTLLNNYFGDEALVNAELQILHEQQVQLGNQQRVLFRLPTTPSSSSSSPSSSLQQQQRQEEGGDDDDDDLFDTAYKTFAIQAKIAVSYLKYEFLLTQYQFMKSNMIAQQAANKPNNHSSTAFNPVPGPLLSSMNNLANKNNNSTAAVTGGTTTKPNASSLSCAIEGQIVILRGDLDEHIMLSLVDR